MPHGGARSSILADLHSTALNRLQMASLTHGQGQKSFD